ncbi:LOW QUALITY PROTEIN: hypothetical protein CRUP_033283 [Coryphaenoides rupestris]|nr:LOW QUALITY PROTEIN: hypothetical protein CRUP_033283 [Coryphaenoides rupestris]
MTATPMTPSAGPSDNLWASSREEEEDEEEARNQDRVNADNCDGPRGGATLHNPDPEPHPDADPLLLMWAPSGKRLLSGLVGLNAVLLGGALVAGQAFNTTGHAYQKPQVYVLLLMGCSLAWMLWYLLWARKQPGISPHKDHHAGGLTVTVVLMLFATFSLLLHLFRMGYYLSMADCTPLAQVLSPFVEAPFLALQGYEVLYPFNMEYYLMAGCMLYVMWKNVGRCTDPAHGPHPPVNLKLTLSAVYRGGVVVGPALGLLVLLVGVCVFVVYQVWVSQPGHHRLTAFLLFYGYHLAVMPLMSLSCLAGMLVHKLERRAQEGGHNPTRSLDVALLVGAALGQLSLSYFSLVAALEVGAPGPLGGLDLSYSLLSLLELMLQNIFIIEGLNRHPNVLQHELQQAEQRVRQVQAAQGSRGAHLQGRHQREVGQAQLAQGGPHQEGHVQAPRGVVSPFLRPPLQLVHQHARQAAEGHQRHDGQVVAVEEQEGGEPVVPRLGHPHLVDDEDAHPHQEHQEPQRRAHHHPAATALKVSFRLTGGWGPWAGSVQRPTFFHMT